MTPYIDVNTDSLDRAANVLREIAADMRIGQFDLFLLDWAAAPHCHGEVASRIRAFAEFAHDQYRDTVALMSFLSAMLALAAADYRSKDAASAQKLARAVSGPTPRPAVS